MFGIFSFVLYQVRNYALTRTRVDKLSHSWSSGFHIWPFSRILGHQYISIQGFKHFLWLESGGTFTQGLLSLHSRCEQSAFVNLKCIQNIKRLGLEVMAHVNLNMYQIEQFANKCYFYTSKVIHTKLTKNFTKGTDYHQYNLPVIVCRGYEGTNDCAQSRVVFVNS